MKVLSLILFFAAVLAHLFFCFPPVRNTPRKLTKPLLMPLLLLVYVFGAKSFTLTAALALLFGFVGDVLLIFPENQKLFTGGLASFAVGHVLYILTFLNRIPARPSLWVVALAVVLYAVGIALMLRFLLPCLPEKLTVPCCVYMVLLCLTSLSALVYALGNPGIMPIIAFLGSVLFLVSDGVLAVVTFRRDFALGNFVVMLTYIAAQSLIIWGLGAYTGGI